MKRWNFATLADFTRACEALPADVVASVFANLDTYLVLANYGRRDITVDTIHTYVPAGEPSAVPRKAWMLGGRSFEILRRHV